MREAATTLAIIRDRGQKGLPLERVYRLLVNRDLYLLAYGKIARNRGALTPGTTDETVDAMSLAKIEAIITALREERYRWTPTRRIYIPKKANPHKTRPLSVPSWSDKLLQEVIRLILDSYFEPQFSDHSHGFRPQRGCHTALHEIDNGWNGTIWFIEGDIQACFDSINHDLLMQMLARHIHDGRFLTLMRRLLKAGYLENWRYNTTPSGVPQGSIVGPVLTNLYLTELDRYVTETLIPHYTRGERHKPNPAYRHLMYRKAYWHKRGKHDTAKALKRRMQQLPSIDTHDPDYRRLHYVRYADDWLLGFVGSKREADEIKAQMRTFLHDKLQLALSDSKTHITHAKTHQAHFLGYALSAITSDTYRCRNTRRINGQIELKVPRAVIAARTARYRKRNHIVHRQELTHDSAYSIVALYQAEYRGLVAFYRMATNLHRLNALKRVMEQSLVKTLARKFRVSVKTIYDRYHTLLQVNGRNYAGLQVTVDRAQTGNPPLVARWGGIPLTRQDTAILPDHFPTIYAGRNELEKRLLADTCELCGSHERIAVHHIRALKDLHKPGRREKPEWVKRMAARQRKTLVVCLTCHQAIHRGDGRVATHSSVSNGL